MIPAHTRKKRGRKPLPEHLPRVEIIHDLPEEQKVCACGAALSRIGQDTCEKLDYVPAKVRVLRHIRYKYACKCCEGVEDDGPTVKIAPAPVQLIEKSMATDGLLAHIIVSKFADALPLYRQQKIFARLGVDLSRAAMANWVVQAAERCAPLIELLEQEIRSGPLIQMDETPLQVLKEPGRANTKTLADEALDYIGKLYQIEKLARESQMSIEQIHVLRQEKTQPILEAFEKWLQKTQPLTPPQGLLGIAINYALRNWDKLTVYTGDGRLKPDNNAAENAIRPFVLGRKNWLFAGAPNGADAAANFFSLIETARANGLEPHSYLRCLFEQLPIVKDPNEYRALLPQNIDPELISASRA